MYRDILCGPFEKDFDGIRADGYLFSMCDDYSNHFYQDSRTTQWYLMEDGSFIIVEKRNDEKRVCTGTFDSSRYEEFVSQMRQFKTDWTKELTYHCSGDIDASDIF